MPKNSGALQNPCAWTRPAPSILPHRPYSPLPHLPPQNPPARRGGDAQPLPLTASPVPAGMGQGETPEPQITAVQSASFCLHPRQAPSSEPAARSGKAARGDETSRSTERLSALPPAPGTSNRSCIPHPDIFWGPRAGPVQPCPQHPLLRQDKGAGGSLSHAPLQKAPTLEQWGSFPHMVLCPTSPPPCPSSHTSPSPPPAAFFPHYLTKHPQTPKLLVASVPTHHRTPIPSPASHSQIPHSMASCTPKPHIPIPLYPPQHPCYPYTPMPPTPKHHNTPKHLTPQPPDTLGSLPHPNTPQNAPKHTKPPLSTS